MLPQEIIKNIPDAIERYLMIGNRLDGNDSKIVVKSCLPPQCEAPGEERVDEAQRHHGSEGRLCSGARGIVAEDFPS